jgi:hypothetical protein
MRHLVYTVRHSLVQTNSSLLTVALHSSVRTILFNDTKIQSLHDVITEVRQYGKNISMSTVIPWSGARRRQIRGVRWTYFCFLDWRASWKAHVLQTCRQSKNVWQRFYDRFLKRPLLTVSRSFMNVTNIVLWRMAIILKANKVNLFVSSILYVFWYHSPNFLDTPRVPLNPVLK